MKLKDYLYQVADDITNLLLYRLSLTVPSLEAGDPTRNAILKIATLLKRAETISAVSTYNEASPPRVKNIAISLRVLNKANNSLTPTASPIPQLIEYDNDKIQVSNKNNEEVITTSAIQQRSNLPKNLRF